MVVVANTQASINIPHGFPRGIICRVSERQCPDLNGTLSWDGAFSRSCGVIGSIGTVLNPSKIIGIVLIAH